MPDTPTCSIYCLGCRLGPKCDRHGQGHTEIRSRKERNEGCDRRDAHAQCYQEKATECRHRQVKSTKETRITTAKAHVCQPAPVTYQTQPDCSLCQWTPLQNQSSGQTAESPPAQCPSMQAPHTMRALHRHHLQQLNRCAAPLPEGHANKGRIRPLYRQPSRVGRAAGADPADPHLLLCACKNYISCRAKRWVPKVRHTRI